MSNGLLSAKQILLSYDVLAPKDLKGKVAKRGTSYEFQDYAYRLASDLNDLEHLNIYMMLAKTVPRYILDRTFEFAGDYNMDSRAKLFMWKLKQVRAELKLQEDLNNFEYSSVIKRSAKFIDLIHKKILEKNKTQNQIKDFLEVNKLEAKNALLIGCNCYEILTNLLVNGSRVEVLDISKELVNVAKEQFSGIKKVKFFKSDLLKKKLKDNYFDAIVINNFWTNIPLESELDVIKRMDQVLSYGGRVILNIINEAVETQSWKKLVVEGEDKYFFEKRNNLEKLASKFNTNNLKLINTFEQGNKVTLVFEK